MLKYSKRYQRFWLAAAVLLVSWALFWGDYTTTMHPKSHVRVTALYFTAGAALLGVPVGTLAFVLFQIIIAAVGPHLPLGGDPWDASFAGRVSHMAGGLISILVQGWVIARSVRKRHRAGEPR